MGADELGDPALPLENLVWRLFNEEPEVRVLAATPLVRGCRCNPEHIRSVIEKFPVEEQREMADENGVIAVDCRFCSKVFPLRIDSKAA